MSTHDFDALATPAATAPWYKAGGDCGSIEIAEFVFICSSKSSFAVREDFSK